ncbi:MAG: Tetratricopeptide repeat [Bacteroidota bacterium]
MALVSSSNEKIYNKEYHVKACQDFDRLVQINDGYRSTYHKRGLVRFFLRDYPSALVDLDRILELKPRDPVATQNLWFIQAFVDSLGVMAS